MLEKSKSELVKIGACDSQVEANYLKKVFEENGIFCFIPGETNRLLGTPSGSSDQPIFVHGAQVEEARDLLDGIRLAQKKGHTVKENMDFENVIAFPTQRERRKRKVSPAMRFSPFSVVAAEKPDKALWLALLISFLLPLGAGHAYVRAFARAGLLLLVQVSLLDFALDGQGLERFWLLAVVPIMDALGAAWILKGRRPTPRF